MPHLRIQPTSSAQPVRPRPYAGLRDLQKMKDLQVKIKSVHPYSSFHAGDMDWWVFYNDAHRDLSRCIRLWEDAENNLIGWTFWVDGDVGFDCAIHPDFRRSHEERVIFEQMEADITDFVRANPDFPAESRRVVTHADADDVAYIAMLEARGFKGSDHMVCLAQDITDVLPEPHLPEGYHFLDGMRPEYCDKRANVHFSAFSPGSRMTPDRYRAFMDAPGYDPNLDTIVVAPDGRFASYAMGWMDATNRLSIFEPVGTHVDFRRLGLGKAVLLEGLRRLKERGIENALVNTGHNPAQIAFYESAGFRIVNYIRQYAKAVE